MRTLEKILQSQEGEAEILSDLISQMRTDDHGLKFGLMNQTSVDVPLRT